MASLALKYRPSNFQDLVGQLHATKSLKNAITHNLLHHAYLFFGSRGVGKTSMARILAKCLNCLEYESPTETPCTSCTNCKEIEKSISLDVLEMDAASNRGIDSVRELRENVKFLPMKSRYKVYIIDEVHALTHDAFNALLKTLEEPPKHVVFIFATTEFHKIPETILSRCQSFSFKKFKLEEIENRLKDILQKEETLYDDEVLPIISEHSEGSLRDALSLLDKLLSYAGGTPLSMIHVQDVLEIIPESVALKVLISIQQRDHVNILKILYDLYQEGLDLRTFLSVLLKYLRNLLLLQQNIQIHQSFMEVAKQKGLLSWDKSEVMFVFRRILKLYQNWFQISLSSEGEGYLFVEVSFLSLLNELEQPSLSKILQKIQGLNIEEEKEDSSLPSKKKPSNLILETTEKKNEQTFTVSEIERSEEVIHKKEIKEKLPTNLTENVGFTIQKEFMGEQVSEQKGMFKKHLDT